MLKRKFLFLLICLWTADCLYAGSFVLSSVQDSDFAAIPGNEEKKQQAKVSDHLFKGLVFTMGNDRWTSGLSYNMDDQKTFSVGVSVEMLKFSVSMDIQRYTSRTDFACYDLLMLAALFPKKITNFLNITVKPGLAIYGNVGLGYIQSVWHNIFNMPKRELDYLKKTTFYPLLAGEVELYHNLNSLRFSTYVKLDCIFSFSLEEAFGIKLYYDGLTVFAEYRFMQGFEDDIVLHKWIEHAQGLRLGYEIQKGVAGIKYFLNPVTRQGYGEIEISLLKSYVETGFEYKFGKTFFIFFQNRDKPVISDFTIVEISRFNFFLQTVFNAGIDSKPMDNSIFSLGYEFLPIKCLAIRPSIQYACFSFQKGRITTEYVALKGEISYSFTLFKHYKLNIFVGGTYFICREFAPDFGIGISLV